MSLMHCLGTLLNDDAGIAVLERKLADATAAAQQFAATLAAAETALKKAESDGAKRDMQSLRLAITEARRELRVASDAKDGFATALAIARSTRANESATASMVSVLLVEDDEPLRSLLQRILQRRGFAVVTANNGRDGMERFHERTVDIVITDMMMPEMGGEDLIRSLRTEQPSVPIIAISGVENPHLGAALGLGAKATLQKPVEAERLVDAVRQVLAA